MRFSNKLAWLVGATSALISLSTSLNVESGGVQPELNLSILTSHKSPQYPIQFRLPPSFSSTIDTNWVPTPGYWYLGTWYFIYTNSATYNLWRNMQWTLSPTQNNSFDGTLNDLTSFQYKNESNPTVYEVYGVDNPLPVGNTLVRDAYDYRPTGPIAPYNNTWEVIGWGYDGKGVPWAALYENAALGQTENFDIISRSDKGPEWETLDLIFSGVRGLKNDVLTSLLNSTIKLVQDGGRNGQPWPTCNSTCMLND